MDDLYLVKNMEIELNFWVLEQLIGGISNLLAHSEEWAKRAAIVEVVQQKYRGSYINESNLLQVLCDMVPSHDYTGEILQALHQIERKDEK